MPLKRELKQLIIETLRLEGLTVDQIGDEQPLFDEALGLDSIDVLELTVAVEKRFGVSIADERTGKHVFASVASLAAFVEQHGADRRPG